jgi:cellulase/cellobiase CelA1
VSTSSSWGGGYVGTVRVTNTGTKAAGWSLSVSHGSTSGLRLYGTWNAQGSQHDDTFTFTGGSLAAGQSASFGYQAGARTRDRLRPTGCSVGNGSCRVS